MAPLHDFATINIPRQIDEEVSGGEVLSQQAPQVLRGHAILDESHALLDPGLQSGVVWVKFYDGDAFGIDTKMLDQNGQRATRYRSKTNEHDSIRKFNPLSLFLPVVVAAAKQATTRKSREGPNKLNRFARKVTRAKGTNKITAS